MDKNPYAPDFDDLPGELPIFPLDGVLLLPSGSLPLNIFEKRYLKMIEDALSGHRLIGMVQTKAGADIYDVGCAGKITEFSETDDGRYVIKLTGICRFGIIKELKSDKPYRSVKPRWSPYENDIQKPACDDLDREKLHELLGQYFSKEEMSCNWKALEEVSDAKLITCLSMVCPFDASEKQALLEVPCCNTRADMFMTMLEMAVREGAKSCKSCH